MVGLSTGAVWERRKRKRAAEAQSIIWNSPGADRPLKRRCQGLRRLMRWSVRNTRVETELGGLRLVVVDDEQARELLAGKWHCVVAAVTVVAGRASLS